jgi:hypothetical protein
MRHNGLTRKRFASTGRGETPLQQQRQKAPKQGSATDPYQYNSISRRRLLISAAAIGADNILGAAAPSAAQDAGKPKPQVLALIGDRFHNSDYIRWIHCFPSWVCRSTIRSCTTNFRGIVFEVTVSSFASGTA